MVDAEVKLKERPIPKHFWKSKTFWAAAIFFISTRLQTYFGFVINPQIQIDILIGVFLLLRIITKEPVDWGLNFPKVDLPKIFVLCLCFTMFACASPLKKACKELTNAHEKIQKAYEIAIVANQQDPTLVSDGNIEELILLRDSIGNLKGTACMLGEILPEK